MKCLVIATSFISIICLSAVLVVTLLLTKPQQIVHALGYGIHGVAPPGAGRPMSYFTSVQAAADAADEPTDVVKMAMDVYTSFNAHAQRDTDATGVVTQAACPSNIALNAGGLSQSIEPFAENMAFPSRQVAQVSQGIYDPLSNRTFIAFPGCRDKSAPTCAVDPYITYYDRGSNTWATPMAIPNSRPPEYDLHTYPQIILDRQGYVHVFNGDHNAPIKHYMSIVKADASNILFPGNWQEQTFSNTTDQDKATYILVFKTRDDTIYLFYRQIIEAVSGSFDTINYIKSTDDGKTWSMPRKLIFPGGKDRSDGSCDDLTDDDEWNTIYIKGLHYQSSPERLHITFENHKEFNLYEDKLFYVYFNFSDEKVYAPNGADLGQCVNQYGFENPVNKTEIYSSGEEGFSDRMSVIGIDANSAVNVFYTTIASSGKATVSQVIWDGTDWSSPIHLFWDEPRDTRPHDVEFYKDNSFDLYGEQREFDMSVIQLVRWHYSNDPHNSQCLKTVIKSEADSEARYDFAFVTNHLPDIKATFFGGQYIGWQNPLPTGKMYTWGRQEDTWVFSVSGQIADVNGQPFQAAISTDAGLTTTADSTGHYTFSVPIGAWTLTPTLSGYIFYPMSRMVTLPPNAINQDFVVLSAPVSITLGLDGGTASFPASLTYTDTQNLVTRLDFPPGATSQTTTLTLWPTLASSVKDIFAGHAFELIAHQQGALQPSLTFSAPVTVTVHYSDSDLRLISDEGKLSLRWWTGNEWQEASEACGSTSPYVRDPENNVLSVAICRAGLLGLFGPTNKIFLPSVLYNFDSSRLAYHPSNDSQPALSPNDQTVVFISDRDGRPDVYRVSTTDRAVVNLTRTSCADEDTPIFSPDGLKIAFASNRTGDWDIYLMGPDGSDVRMVVGNLGTDELQPSFTPDGLGIIFSSNRANGNWDIYTATLDGGGWTRLTSDLAADRFPSFSRDGATIVFRSERDGNSEIYLMSADGSDLRRVTNDPAFDGYPVFIPDGSGILFVSARSGVQNVYQVNLAGDGLRALEQRPGLQMDTPRLSQNGRLLVYAGGPIPQPLDIYMNEFVSSFVFIGHRGATGLAK